MSTIWVKSNQFNLIDHSMPLFYNFLKSELIENNLSVEKVNAITLRWWSKKKQLN